MNKKTMLDVLTTSYLETALWSSTDYEGNELDSKFSIYDLDEKCINQAHKDCWEFYNKASHLLDDHDFVQIGHDFWLTRNHHGAGFWDGDYEHGDKLTEIAQNYSELDLNEYLPELTEAV